MWGCGEVGCGWYAVLLRSRVSYFGDCINSGEESLQAGSVGAAALHGYSVVLHVCFFRHVYIWFVGIFALFAGQCGAEGAVVGWVVLGCSKVDQQRSVAIGEFDHEVRVFFADGWEHAS